MPRPSGDDGHHHGQVVVTRHGTNRSGSAFLSWHPLLFISLAILTGVVSLAVACGGDGDETPTASRASPPAPPVPPESLSQKIALILDVVPTPTTTTTCPDRDSSVEATAKSVSSGQFRFDPDAFTFNVGDVVTFELVAEAEFHTFTVDELGIDCGLDGGTTTFHTFTFDEAGTFPLICIPHESQGMVGSITVLP